MSTSGPVRGLQDRVDALLAGPGAGGEAATRRPDEPAFSAYVDDDLGAATELASELMALADDVGGVDGLRAALDESERRLVVAKPGLVAHAVRLFVTHHGVAARRLRIPPLERRQSIGPT